MIATPSPWKGEGPGGGLNNPRALTPSRRAIRITRLDWHRCSSNRGVTLYRIEGGGHQVLGHTNFFPLVLGFGTDRISATDIIMTEFARR